MEALFAHIPGLKVICPSCPQDAKGLLKSAIRDDDPVISLEHKVLYPQKGEIDDSIDAIPLGVASVKREGSDVSLITWSRQVQFSLEAAEQLSQQGIQAEVLDLRTLVPLDWDAIRQTVSKTHRAVIVEEDVRRCGFGAEIAAELAEKLFDELDAPIVRVASLNSSVPFAPVLEEEIYPHPEQIVAAVTDLLAQ
jgi:pyruvate dehydrogenase E1 component beta subunit